MGAIEDQKRKAVGTTTRFFFRVPRPRLTLVYLLAFSFIAGIVSRAFYGKISVGGLVVFGGADGILLLALPALFSALLAAGFTNPRDFRSSFKYYFFLAFAAAVLAAIVYAAGVAAFHFAAVDLLVSFVLANALVAALWFATTLVALNAKWRSAPVSLLQPFFNLAFLFLWSKTSVLEAGVVVESPLVTGVKLLLATLVLLVALWSLFYVINAPAKRNLGVSAIQAAALFFAQSIRGSNEFEHVLEEMGEPALVPLRAISFKTRDGKPKALFVVPSLHYGPFGNVGGSEFPARLSAELGQRHGRVFVWHGLVNHDFNPVESGDYALVAASVEKALKEPASADAGAGGFFESRYGAASVAGFAFGGNAARSDSFVFATLTRAPQSTEDFEYGLGEALRAQCANRFGVGTRCVLADRHNSLTDASEVTAGSEAFAEYEEAVRAIEPPKQAPLRLGVGAVPDAGFSPAQGVGRAGVRAAVFEFGSGGERKRFCLVLVDANNCVPSFRAEAAAVLKKKFGFHWADVSTSDTHSVNSLSGVYNPLPGSAAKNELLAAIEKAAALAARDLEPCKARFAETRVRIEVMGAESQSEMLSTINSIIAVAKILAPVVLVASLALVAAFLLLWK